MPCGKRPLVKLWDKPRQLTRIKASKYQQNEASVKVHWKNVVKDLENFYTDDKFWESQSSTVRTLVGPVIFERLAKIFDLPLQEEPYVPPSEPSEIAPSEEFYNVEQISSQKIDTRPSHSISDLSAVLEEEEEEEEERSSSWTASTDSSSGPAIAVAAHMSHSRGSKRSKSNLQVKSGMSLSKMSLRSPSKLMSRVYSRTFGKSYSKSFSSKAFDAGSMSSEDDDAFTDDDVIVHADKRGRNKSSRRAKRLYNPHFEMLYCSESITDMIKWDSRTYKRRTFDLSSSDEYSKKAELLTKQIAYDFYAWWTSVGSPDYKSEIKRPRDIEDLFQVWFNEHASRGLVLDPKILPCVLQKIANYVGAPKASCPAALKRQIAWDIHAETSPAHTSAFNASLPQKMKHIPPKNNTAEMWHAVRIPEDLKTMSAVWGGIAHLTSTKSFKNWLQHHPYMPMPPFLKGLGQPGDKKQLFVIPSDFVFKDKSVDGVSTQELNIPVSKMSIEIKEVLSRLLND